ncbi:hypothetical protein [Neptuniibacter sp. QD34_54]|uniref:hypothetical protein n=1 Tax=Neptuniibacter sp. QD34_54 TaxID=3398208 RepID=UPI0039F61424
MSTGLSSSACKNSIEEAVMWSFLIAFIAFISSVMIIFSDESNQNSKSKNLLWDWYWPVLLIFTGKHLSEESKMWRPVFLCSLLYCVGGFYLAEYLGVCVKET